MSGHFERFRVSYLRLLGALSLMFVLSVNGHAMTISPSPSYTGNYSVSWGGGGQTGCQPSGYPPPYPPYICYYLYENGSQVTQSSPYNVSGRPAGTYHYDVGVDYFYYQDILDSADVIVGTPPPRDPIPTQLSYQYQIRAGDYGSNGRTDLYVKRTSGGVPGNGVLDELLLWQNPSGGFVPIVPSASQSSIASSWPLSSATPVVSDVNVDGFVDVALKGVAAATGASSDDQIIYSSGVPLDPEPLGLRAVDASLKQFVGNSLDYFVNPAYFDENASIEYFQGYVYYYYCTFGGGSYGVLDDMYYGLYLPCYFYYEPLYGYYVDYSEFSMEAVTIWTSEEEHEAGAASATESTQAAQEAAEEALEVEIGGWPMEEVLGSSGEHTDPDVRRGLESFWGILRVGQIYSDQIEPEYAYPQTFTLDCVTLNVRHVGGLGPIAQHASIVYRSAPVWQWIGGYDSDPDPFVDGTLISDRNRGSDDPSLTMIASLVSPGGGTPCLPATDLAYWTQVLAAEANYDDNLNYMSTPAPVIGYNSNGFAHGILNATGGSAEVSILDRLVGWSYPVPPSAFE